MNRPINLSERLKIQILIKKNYSHHQIAQKIERSSSSVSREIKRNGGNDVYNAKSANERAIREQVRKNKVVSERLKKTYQYINIDARLRALENAVINLSLENEKLKKSTNVNPLYISAESLDKVSGT